MTGAVTYDGNSLQTANIITNVIDHTNMPEKVLSLYSLATADASVIPMTDYPLKSITIEGAIKGSSQADLDERIDLFKGYFRGKDKNLDINYNNTTRRYTATVNSLSVTRRGSLDFANFTIQFTCPEPFGRETTPTVFINESAYDESALNVTPTIGGSAPSQLPVFTITINAITGEGDFVAISNDNNNQQIVVLGYDLEAGDVVVIDCAQRIVTLNGEPILYEGSFIELEPGGNSITYTDGFSTRSVDIHAQYFKRYF